MIFIGIFRSESKLLTSLMVLCCSFHSLHQSRVLISSIGTLKWISTFVFCSKTAPCFHLWLFYILHVITYILSEDFGSIDLPIDCTLSENWGARTKLQFFSIIFFLLSIDPNNIPYIRQFINTISLFSPLLHFSYVFSVFCIIFWWILCCEKINKRDSFS